jgi:hypothetical protein
VQEDLDIGGDSCDTGVCPVRWIYYAKGEINPLWFLIN